MSKRTLKYKTISKSEEAPVVGSVVEEKDTIFVKQVSATEFEVYVSDETGYVVKLDKTIDKASFDQMVLEYIKEHYTEIKNTLNLTPSHSVGFGNYGVLDVRFHHNGKKVEFTSDIIQKVGEGGYIKYFYRENDNLVIKGEDYPKQYVSINRNKIIGKNLIDDFMIHWDDTSTDSNVYELRPIEEDNIEKKILRINRFEKLSGSSVSLYNVVGENSMYIDENQQECYTVSGVLSINLNNLREGELVEFLDAENHAFFVARKDGEIGSELLNKTELSVVHREERVEQRNLHIIVEDSQGIAPKIYTKTNLGLDAEISDVTVGDNTLKVNEFGEYYISFEADYDNRGKGLDGKRFIIKNADTEEVLSDTTSQYDNLNSVETPLLISQGDRIKIIIE